MRSGALEPTATRRGEVAVSGPAREALRMVTETTHSLGTPPSWDGTWSLVIIRGSGTAASPHGVRNTLLTEGLGRLGNGVWITPHSARSERTVALLEEDPALDLLTCTATFEHLRHPEIVAQAWDLERIRRGYDEFIELMTALSAGTDRERFVAWTTAVRAWHQLMHSDPGLPPETIGADWPWMQVRRLMTSARDSWRAAAVRHADALVTGKRSLL
jgi:phenylacetic acid degradation operon negative regulatory protein